MRILHIINSLGTGGAEKILTDSLQMYVEKGVKVDLLLLDGTEKPFYKKLKENFEGVIYFTSIKSLYNPLQVLRIRKYFKNYDIIHVHLFPSLYWVALARMVTQSKCKFVFTEHSTSNNRIKNIFFRQIDKVIYKLYDTIIAITPAVKKGLEDRLNLPKNKCIVINNGVNLTRINQAVSLNKAIFFNQINAIILIQVSRFDTAKDQKTIIRALKNLPERFKLILVGEGNFKKDCEELVSSLNLNERVLFLGIRMDIPELLKMADIVVQSSNWEGFGLVAVEGMAANKPVVASDVAGLREVVGGAGVLFEKGNELDFAHKIRELIENTIYYDRVRLKCFEKSKLYSMDIMVNETLMFYKNII